MTKDTTESPAKVAFPSRNVGLLIGIIIIVVALGLFLVQRQPSLIGSKAGGGASPGDVVITLTEDGFEPETVTITKGKTVTFTSTTGEYYWPASNLHPSHTIYPEFDPKEPIDPDATWSFTFEKTGEWKFHDHIAPYYTGVIIVEE